MWLVPSVFCVTVPPRIGMPLVLSSLRASVMGTLVGASLLTWICAMICPVAVLTGCIMKLRVGTTRASRIANVGRRRRGVCEARDFLFLFWRLIGKGDCRGE